MSEGASHPSHRARRCRCRLMWHKMAIKGEEQRAEAIKLITDVTDWNPLCGFCVAEGGVHDLISSIHFITFFPAEQLMQREFGTVIVCCSLSCWNWACSLYLLLGVSDIKKWRRGSLWRSAGFVCLNWCIGFWINGENSELFYSRIEILGSSLFLQSVLAKLHWQHIWRLLMTLSKLTQYYKTVATSIQRERDARLWETDRQTDRDRHRQRDAWLLGEM